jgi:hypothetical protein
VDDTSIDSGSTDFQFDEDEVLIISATDRHRGNLSTNKLYSICCKSYQISFASVFFEIGINHCYR